MKKYKTMIQISLVMMMLITTFVHEHVIVATSIQDIYHAEDMVAPGSYRLMDNITLSQTMTIKQNQTYHIDLNGYQITSEVKNSATEITQMFENYGTLTIEDTSIDKTGVITTEALYEFLNYGNLTILSGNFQSDVVGKKITIDGVSTKYNARLIRNEGSLVIHNGNFQTAGGAINTRPNSSTVINGGTFISTSSNQSQVDGEKGYYTYCVTNNGKMTIYDATIKGIQGALSSSSGELYVYDGDFSTDWNNSNSFYALYVAGELDVSTGYIYGGRYSSKRSAAFIGNDADGGNKKDATVFVYGGEYIGGEKAMLIAEKTAKDPLIQGGSYFTATSDTGEKQVFTPIKDYLNEEFMLDEKTGEVLQKDADSITLDKSNIILEVGTKQMLVATLTPSNVVNNEITWSSSDSNVASVNNKGEVIAKAPGKTNISASVKGKTATCEVKVYTKEIIAPPTIDPSEPVEEVTVGIQDSTALNTTIQALFEGNNTSFVNELTYNNMLKAIDDGKTISVAMAFDLIQHESLSPDIVENFNNQANLLAASDETAVIAQYLDLSIQLMAENDKLGELNQLVQPLPFSIALPQEFIETNREYYVLRMHEDTITALPATRNGTILTFETDRFSTYALVYVDKINHENSLPGENNPDDSGSSINGGVNTGIASNDINGYILLMGISIITIFSFYKKRQSCKNEKRK